MYSQLFFRIFTLLHCCVLRASYSPQSAWIYIYTIFSPLALSSFYIDNMTALGVGSTFYFHSRRRLRLFFSGWEREALRWRVVECV